jgi:hypothetical protein
MKALWGGELPEFDSTDALNALLAALIRVYGTGLSGTRSGACPCG